MNVKELIIALLECPMEAEVYIAGKQRSLDIDEVSGRSYSRVVELRPVEPMVCDRDVQGLIEAAEEVLDSDMAQRETDEGSESPELQKLQKAIDGLTE